MQMTCLYRYGCDLLRQGLQEPFSQCSLGEFCNVFNTEFLIFVILGCYVVFNAFCHLLIYLFFKINLLEKTFQNPPPPPPQKKNISDKRHGSRPGLTFQQVQAFFQMLSANNKNRDSQVMDYILILKVSAKNTSKSAVCLYCLLHIFANIID